MRAKDEQVVVVPALEQSSPKQGAGLEIVWGFDDSLDGSGHGVVIGDVGVDLKCGSQAQMPDGHATVLPDAHAQDRVLGHDAKGTNQVVGPQIPLEFDHPTDVGHRGVGMHQVQHPETLLDGGQGEGARRRRHCRCG